jgi:YVTN family beta-propeller protein
MTRHLKTAFITATVLFCAIQARADFVDATVTVGTGAWAVAADTATNMIYVSNYSSNNVTVINGATNSTATVSAGSEPYAIAVNAATNMIYVANQVSNNVTVINGATNATITVAAGAEPDAIAVNAATNMIYVANSGDSTVTVINGTTNNPISVKVGNDPQAIAVNPVTNKIYVVNTGSNTVTVIDGATNTTTTVGIGSYTHAIAVNAVTNKIYVSSDSNITVIDGTTNIASNVCAGTYSYAITVNPVTNMIYVANYNNSNVTVINGATNTTTTVAAGAEPYAIAVNAATNMIYVANYGMNELEGPPYYTTTVINGATNTTTTVATEEGSRALAVNSVTNRIYVVNSQMTPGTVSVIDGTQVGGVSLVSPTNNAINVTFNPTLQWTTATNATGYNVQVSRNSAFTTTYPGDAVNATVTTDTLTVALYEMLNEGTRYYWEVAGTYGSSIGPWAMGSFTTGQIAAPILISPADKATIISFKPTLQWSTVMYATAYIVQISTNNTFITSIFNSTISSDTVSAFLNGGTKYYWRVEGTCGSNIGPWAMDSFTTAQVAPAAPTLATPTNGAINVALNTTLSWNPSSGATAYRVQCSNSTSFSFLTDTTIAGTSRALNSLTTFSTYYWRVNASNAYGTSPWSAIDSFSTVGTAPNTPILLYPTNGSTTAPMNPGLTWNSCAHASTYEVQVSINSSFTLVMDTVVSGTIRNLTTLTAYTTYYWRVDACNTYGTSAWSTVWNFTTTNSGVINSQPHYAGAMIGYSGILAVYSLDGRRVMEIPFTASATRETVLKIADKMPAKGVYSYQFLKERKIMDEGNFIVK